jgi:hydroxybutyrate-dimer hydrolase
MRAWSICTPALVVLMGAASAGARAEHGGPDESGKWRFGTVRHTFYDGTTNDLLTGGLGKSGLQAGAATPSLSSPPTSAELRTLAIFNNYRALVDYSPKGGYGVLYGPNIDLNGADTLGQGMIAGDEYLAYADDGSGRQNVTTMVQVPVSFDPANACIVTAVSSGSRGVYGAIATAGEWGLKRGCAVAYSDKGTGNGAHDLQTDTVNLIDGVRADALVAGTQSNFTADLSASELAAFNAATPYRFAYKHAHSQQNPEKDWGLHTLLAVKFAFQVLNQQFPGHGRREPARFTKANTLVIASSASNGAGAAIAAAEQDQDGLIDGVAVSEPQIQPRRVEGLLIQRGSQTPFAGGGKPLYEYFTLANLLQPCAAQSASVAASPFLGSIIAARAANRCAALKARGLLTSTGTAAQADEALALLHAAGWQPESDLLHASHYGTAAVPAVTLTYANSYGRFSVVDNLCGYSFAAISAAFAPAPIAPGALAAIFGTGNGVPPTGTIQIINNDSVGGPLLDGISVSPSSGVADYNADGAFCLRALAGGGSDSRQSERVADGIEQVLRNGDLHGKPVLIVQGRSDTLVPVNFASRYYLGLNRLVEGRDSQLRYYEITNAQHFDAFIDLLPGYDTLLVPLHVYLVQALNLMYAHLKSGAPLPPSQVVYTVPRGGVAGLAPPITTVNVPPIDPAPQADHLITFSNRTVHVPE